MTREYRPPTATPGIWAEVRAATADGQVLDRDTRRTLECSFDTDLREIRVHAEVRADRLARALRADAFAAGPHLFFRAGAYRPRTESGLRLLAHEVAHSIQQSDGPLFLTSPAREAELIADEAADRVVAGRPAPIAGGLTAVPPLSADGPFAIQRHGSWEHRLLGDASSDDLYSLSHAAPNRTDLLKSLRDYLQMWQVNPDHVTPDEITERYKDIRTVTLKTSGLLVTYGELNTLPDYRQCRGHRRPAQGDPRSRSVQAVRQEGYANVLKLLGDDPDFQKFDYAVTTYLSNGTLNDVWESIWLDVLTANLPTNHSGRVAERRDEQLRRDPRQECLPFRPVLLVSLATVVRRGRGHGPGRLQVGRRRDRATGLDPARVRRSLPPGLIRCRPSHQQDPRDAVVRRLGRAEVVRQRPGLGRRSRR